jgi:hypothetical protein
MNTKRTPAVKSVEPRHLGRASNHTPPARSRARSGRASRIAAVRPPPEPTDARALRYEQAIVTIVLLTGFVFRVGWVIPVLALLIGLAAFAGPDANVFGRSYAYLFFGRAPASRAPEAPGVTRATRLVEAGLLLAGSVLFLLGADAFAWVFALPVAAITGLAATTGINLVALVLERSQRR